MRVQIDYTRFHLWVGNLPTGTRRQLVVDLFERRGFRVAFAWFVAKHPKTNEPLPRAHCYIELANPRQEEHAIKACDGLHVFGHDIAVTRFVPLEKRRAWQSRREATEKPRASFHSDPHPTWRGEWQPASQASATLED